MRTLLLTRVQMRVEQTIELIFEKTSLAHRIEVEQIGTRTINTFGDAPFFRQVDWSRYFFP